MSDKLVKDLASRINHLKPKQRDEARQQINLRLQDDLMKQIKSDIEALDDEGNKELHSKLEKTKKKNKKNKDKNAPKRPRSSFMFFMSAKRPELKEAHPDWIQQPLFAKELGKLWDKMSDEEKKPYNDLMEEDKKRYKNEMKNYVPPPPDSLDSSIKTTRKKRKKDKDAPKGPLNPYSAFVKSQKGKTFAMLGEEWGEMSDESKQPFQTIAKKDKERYKNEMEEYKEKKNKKREREEDEEEKEEEEEDSDDSSSTTSSSSA